MTPVQGSVSLLVANRQLWAWLRTRSARFTLSVTLSSSSCGAPGVRDVAIPGPFLMTP